MAEPNPTAPSLTTKDIQRFHGKVDRRGPDECWPWLAGAQRGYGYFTISRRSVKSHRLAYFLQHGVWSAMLICHRCDNPICCNPSHLFLGTWADNMRDRDRKGRASCGPSHMAHIPLERLPHGSGHGNAKLTEEQVVQLRLEYAAGGVSQETLGHKYGVDQTIVSDIVRRKTWRHVA